MVSRFKKANYALEPRLNFKSTNPGTGDTGKEFYHTTARHCVMTGRLCRGCVTPKQLGNLSETIDGNFDYLDGYEDLTPELQEKVKLALEQGHVDDNDWKGVSTKDLFLLRPVTHA